MAKIRVAVLDDWQNAAAGLTDWSALNARAELTFFQRHFPAEAEAEAVKALADFDVLLLLRERSRLSATLIERLPKLKMLSLTGTRAPHVDVEACTKRGIPCTLTVGGHSPAPTAELALGLLIAAARDIAKGDAAIRAGHFQQGIAPGMTLEHRTLGIVGLGRIGGMMARYGQALGMRVIAWSQNLTDEKAAKAGAVRVNKETLFAEADAITIHLVLSDRSRGIVGAEDIARMKKGAILINTSRGPLVDEAALMAAARAGNIVAAVDVYNTEPLPQDSPWRTLPNSVLTPHLGFTSREGLGNFYEQAAQNIVDFLDGKPINAMNADGLKAQR